MKYSSPQQDFDWKSVFTEQVYRDYDHPFKWRHIVEPRLMNQNIQTKHGSHSTGIDIFLRCRGIKFFIKTYKA